MLRTIAVLLAFSFIASSAQAPDVISARQEAMDMSSVTLNSISQSIKAGREPNTQQYSATALSKWAKTLPTMFPRGTAQGESSAETQALPAIWQDRAGFEKAATTYQDATAKLVALATANDSANFPKQIDEVKQACNNCHDHYKAGPKRAPSK